MLLTFFLNVSAGRDLTPYPKGYSPEIQQGTGLPYRLLRELRKASAESILMNVSIRSEIITLYTKTATASGKTSLKNILDQKGLSIQRLTTQKEQEEAAIMQAAADKAALENLKIELEKKLEKKKRKQLNSKKIKMKLKKKIEKIKKKLNLNWLCSNQYCLSVCIKP